LICRSLRTASLRVGNSSRYIRSHGPSGEVEPTSPLLCSVSRRTTSVVCPM
jgi:hypothetical protein